MLTKFKTRGALVCAGVFLSACGGDKPKFKFVSHIK